MEKIFAELASEKHLAEIADIETFTERASHYIAEINAIHPFREGNGRCQLTLLCILMEISGFEMNEDKLNPEEFMSAMIDSFHGNNRSLHDCIRSMATE